jgi:hypothetical protein
LAHSLSSCAVSDSIRRRTSAMGHSAAKNFARCFSESAGIH